MISFGHYENKFSYAPLSSKLKNLHKAGMIEAKYLPHKVGWMWHPFDFACATLRVAGGSLSQNSTHTLDI